MNGMVLINADDENAVSVGKTCPRAYSGSGLLAQCGEPASSDVSYSARGLDLHVVPYANLRCRLPGEFNVRNAAMAIRAARFYGMPLEVIQKAVASFRRREAPAGSARRVRTGSK
ncbi:MAG: hypothetical protein QM796_12380 [Chthoniobacteraceae bacterium]